MGLFSRKSRWDVLKDSASTAVKTDALRSVGKVGAGIVAGLVSVTAVSAAISQARQQGQQ